MAFHATCDICKKPVTKLADLNDVHESLRLPGVIEHICGKCFKRIKKQMEKLSDYYKRELSADLREFISDIFVK